MPLPPPVEAVWQELEAVRAQILKEVEGLSQRQADWRPAPNEWSVGELIHHLTLAEIGTGKLTSKLLKEAPHPLPPFPADLKAFAPITGYEGGAQAPDVVRPEAGHPIGELLATIKATRERSRQTLERLATVDPRQFKWKHFRLGELDLGQWWRLQARHDVDHFEQLRAIKAAPGFPTS